MYTWLLVENNSDVLAVMQSDEKPTILDFGVDIDHFQINTVVEYVC